MNLIHIYRRFKHQQAIAWLRIISMGLGMASALILFYLAMNELTVDNFYPGKNNIYQVFVHYKSSNFEGTYTSLFQPVVPAMVADIPQVQQGTVAFINGKTNVKVGESLIETDAIYADSSFFKVFKRPFLAGTAGQSLSLKNTAVITRKFARKLFGNEYAAIGKVIYLNQTRPIQITGMVENWPQNASFNAGIILSFATLKDENRLYMGWGGGDSFQGFVKLAKNSSAKEIDNAIPGLLSKYYDVKAAEAKGDYIKYKLVPLTKAYLTANPDEKKSLSIMILIGVLILGLACFNSLLLILSGRQKFHKEIFIQRTLGASGFDIQKLIFNETLFYMMASLAVAFGFILLINPYIETYYYQTSLVSAFSSGSFILLATLIFLVAFVITYWVPVRWAIRYFTATRESQYVSRSPVNTYLQRALLTFQIGISICLFIFLWVIHNQFNYITHFNQGYNPNNLIYIELQNKPLYSKDRLIRSEIAKLPNVISVCLSDDIPLWGLSGNSFTRKPDGKDIITFRNLSVGPNFFATLGMKMRGAGFRSDVVNKNNIIITEKAAKILNMNEPLGKTIYRGEPLTIKGVVPDFISGSLHLAMEPTVFTRYYQPSVYSTLTVRIASNQMKNTVNQIKNTIEKIVPRQIVQVNDYNSVIRANYQRDIALKNTIGFFTIFAFLITLAGLIGFTTTMINGRSKELGVRKVNGASAQSLLLLLNKVFLWNIAIAIIVFVPISYQISKIWLQNYTYAVPLNTWIFVLASIVASMVVLSVVSVFTLKAARRNPVEVLRYE